MKKQLIFLTAALCIAAFSVKAEENAVQPVNMRSFAKYYKVNLDAPLPDLQALSAEYAKANELFNPRYVLSWDMGPVFDRLWAVTITSYGTSEKRIKSAGEDELYEMIKMLPKEYYPYIGPMLHKSPGISEKILNMPGIKETKNKFPERIAPQLQGIEDLEFLSPYLYILLMPEMWPENNKHIEKPRLRPAKQPQVKYNPEFYADLLRQIPDEGFGGAARTNQKAGFDQLRTLHITSSSPLTGADVKAFASTLGNIKAFSTVDNMLKLINAGRLMDYWEQKNGTALAVNSLKDAANPCQRLALKVKWAGLETEFAKVYSSEGFDLNGWAYTCDKTIKAYRIARISSGKLAGIRAYREGVYDAYINSLTPKWRDNQFAAMQSIIEMYKAPRDDVFTVLKNETLLNEKITPLGGMLASVPIAN